MEYENELLDEWLGQPVLFTELVGPDPAGPEEMEKLWEDPRLGFFGPPRSRTSVVLFEGYDPVGVTVRWREEGAPQVFVPWGAVLSINGYTR